MSYIAQTYNPYSIGAQIAPSLDKIQELADLAADDIFPNSSYSNYEVQIWMIMRRLVDYEVDRRNHYKKEKGAKPVFATFTRPIAEVD